MTVSAACCIALRSKPTAPVESKTMFTELKKRLPSREFHDRIYAGEMFCFRQLPEMQAIIAASQSHAEACLAPLHPTRAHNDLSRAALIDTFGAYRRKYHKNEDIQSLWSDFFAAIGFDLGNIARDRTLARVQVPFEQSPNHNSDLVTAPLAFHRDTWGSNVYAQVNWWAPIYPITAERTMQIFPDLWDKPLKNTSGAFDLLDVVEAQQKSGRRQKTPDDHIPHLAEDSIQSSPQPVIIEPGDIIAFSGAHAHGSVPNSTDTTRLSLETRTVAIDDIHAGRGAPNLDGHAKWMAPGWFTRMSDGVALNDVMGLPKFIENDRAAIGVKRHQNWKLQSALSEIEALKAQLNEKEGTIAELRKEIAILEQKQWLVEGCGDDNWNL